MKIAVLDYSSGSVDIFEVPEGEHIEWYLTEEKGYRLDDIYWMEAEYERTGERVGKVMDDGTIVVLVHHAWAPRDPYTEIQYPPFDELWKNDKFKKECMRNFFENSDDKFVAELARWLQYGSECRYPCPLLPVDLYFTADGLEKRWFNYQDDVPTAEDIIANLVFENSLA